MTKPFQRHLWERLHKLLGGTYQRPWKDVHVDLINEVVTFELRHYGTKQLAGVQVYSWKANKVRSNSGRYVTHTKKGLAAIFGLEYIEDYDEVIFFVEGIMDAIAIRNLGYRAIALMSNCIPKSLAGELANLPNTVAVCDEDGPGAKLSKYAKKAIHLPEGQDPSSMDRTDLRQLLEDNNYA